MVGLAIGAAYTTVWLVILWLISREVNRSG